MNPFQSPLTAASGDVLPRTPLPGILTQRGFLKRKIELPEPYRVSMTYNGLVPGFEEVRVDGRLACRRWAHFWFPSCFEFWLDVGSERRPAKLWVEIGLWLNIRRLTVVVDNQVVYDEP